MRSSSSDAHLLSGGSFGMKRYVYANDVASVHWHLQVHSDLVRSQVLHVQAQLVIIFLQCIQFPWDGSAQLQGFAPFSPQKQQFTQWS